jgi:hypothetical protein
MKAIISTTYDSKYLFFLPIVAWCWRKLGVDVVCFVPYLNGELDNKKIDVVNDALRNAGIKIQYVAFDAPEHKQATYAQCSRLYGACLDLPENEVLITSDIDMAVFKIPPHEEMFWDALTIYGGDLVPPNQYPMCYAIATVKDWRSVMKINGKAYQQCLDDLLGHIEAEHFRGNYWGKDQEELYNKAHETAIVLPRARAGTQFASNRYDRDDAYILDRLSPDTVDFHMNRPGFEDGNFEIILKILQYHYPNDDLSWMRTYQEEYKKLLWKR